MKNLVLLLVKEGFIIKALSAGNTTIVRAKKTFRSYIDPDFKSWGLDNKQPESKEVEVKVYELKQDAKFSQMFNSLNTDLDRLCLTQSQIINFCQKHSKNLRQNDYTTFLLFKENDEFFVASVDVESDGLLVCVFRFKDDDVWSAKNAHLLVAPTT